jgi:hypothetical protein
MREDRVGQRASKLVRERRDVPVGHDTGTQRYAASFMLGSPSPTKVGAGTQQP